MSGETRFTAEMEREARHMVETVHHALSDRLRPNVECAPWVVGSVKELEQKRDDLLLYTRLLLGEVNRLREALADQNHESLCGYPRPKFDDGPMSHPPIMGWTPKQVEVARQSILEAEDDDILVFLLRTAEVHEWDESIDPKKLEYPDGTPEEHARKLGELLKKTLPADDPRKPEDLVCCHPSSSECECVCHTNNVILHDRACCAPCKRCGFHTVEK